MRSVLKAFCVCCALMFISVGFGVCDAYAATLTQVSDSMSDHSIGATSTHDIAFVTPTGVHASTETIEISLSSFDVSSIVASDVALSHGPSSGDEIIETLASTAAVGVWGVSISGSQVVLTPPTDAIANEIASNDIVRIRVGNTNQVINPSIAGGYQGTIGGLFGDTGVFGLIVVYNDQVLVTAEYRGEVPPGGGGHGQGSDNVPPLIVNVIATSTTPTSAIIQWLTNEQASSMVGYGQTSVYASGTIADSSLSYQHSMNISDLHPCTTYYFQVTSSDASGNQAVSS